MRLCTHCCVCGVSVSTASRMITRCVVKSHSAACCATHLAMRPSSSVMWRVSFGVSRRTGSGIARAAALALACFAASFLLRPRVSDASDLAVVNAPFCAVRSARASAMACSRSALF